jgi:hypothetical protein
MRAIPTRRDFLWQLGGGLGGIALAQLLGRSDLLAQEAPAAVPGDLNGGLHHRAKVKRIVQLFMNGGMSPVDTFDYKPELEKRHGQKFDPGQHVESVTGSHDGFPILKSPFSWKQYGESGRWVSSVFPKLATRVDDLAFLMSMTSKTNVHGPGSYDEHGPRCPASVHGRLDLRARRAGDDLPSFVVLPDPRGPPTTTSATSRGFLGREPGRRIQATAPPIHDLSRLQRADTKEGETSCARCQVEPRLRSAGRRRHAARTRIASYELAADAVPSRSST